MAGKVGRSTGPRIRGNLLSRVSPYLAVCLGFFLCLGHTDFTNKKEGNIMDKAIFRDAKAKLAFRKALRIGYESPAEMPWDDLHETRSSIQKGLDDLLLKVQSDGREISESEQLAYDYGIAALDQLGEEFKLREKVGTKDPVDRKTPVNPPQPPFIIRQQGDNFEFKLKMPGEWRYKDLFPGPLDNGGFRNFNEFVAEVGSGRMTERLLKRAMGVGVGASGGFAVPASMASAIFDQILEQSIVMSRASLTPMGQGPNLEIPVWDSTDHKTGPGMLECVWTDENIENTEQEGKLRQVLLASHKCAIFVSASNELLEDAGVPMEQQLGAKMVQALTFGIDRALLTGNGLGKPMGSLYQSGIISVNRQVASQISYTDLLLMFSRIYPPSIGRSAAWIMNPTCIPQLFTIKDAGNNSLFVANAAGTAPTAIFGIPLIISEKVPALGSKGDLSLTDFSQLAVGLKRDLFLERSNAPRWFHDQSSFRVTCRIASRALWTDPVTPAEGTQTLGWGVVLDVP